MKFAAVLKDQSKNGMFNIKIRITKDRKIGYIKTDYYCLAEDFDTKSGRLKDIKVKNGQALTQELKNKRETHNYQNSEISKKLAEFNLKYAKLTNKDQDINWLCDYFKDNAGDELNLVSYYEEFIRNLRKQNRTSYAVSHNTTLQRLIGFSDKRILFKNVNYQFLESFENRLKDEKCSTNTIAIYLRNLRAVFNDAIKKDRIELGLYPFRRFEISRRLKPVIRKRNLSIDIIRKLKNAEIQDELKCRARDIFMLSFYLIGINLKDLFNLESIKDGRIHYYRAKTRRYYDVKVFPAALELIDKYRGRQNLLIFKELYSDYRNLNKLINEKLKEIAQSDDFKLDTIPTTYFARHSWATLASQLDIPRDVISHALGHGNNTITDTYIDFNISKVDEANLKVINFLNDGQNTN